MPRPDKPINPGPLSGPASSSRSHAWSKHGDTAASGYRGAPTEIEVEVEDLVITTDSTVPDLSEELSKFDKRGTAAHVVYDKDLEPRPMVELVPDWTVERSIDGRIYLRTDTMKLVESTPAPPSGPRWV